MKIKTIILIITGLIIGLIFLYIVALGYGGGKAVRPASSTKEMVDLKTEIQKKVQTDQVNINIPRNYEIDNCNKYGFQKQGILIYIENDSLKNEKSLKKYTLYINKKLQKIFPYNKQCYDSVIIETKYFFNEKRDSIIYNRFSFPMIK